MDASIALSVNIYGVQEWDMYICYKHFCEGESSDCNISCLLPLPLWLISRKNNKFFRWFESWIPFRFYRNSLLQAMSHLGSHSGEGNRLIWFYYSRTNNNFVLSKFAVFETNPSCWAENFWIQSKCILSLPDSDYCRKNNGHVEFSILGLTSHQQQTDSTYLNNDCFIKLRPCWRNNGDEYGKK